MSRQPTTPSAPGPMTRHAHRVLAHQQAMAAGANGEAADLADPPDLPIDPSFSSAPVAIKARKRVTTPVLSWPAGSAVVFRFLDAIHESEVQDTRYPGKAQVCKIEAPNGDVRVLIAGTVLKAAIERDYPKDGYVGLWFHVLKMPARSDKHYADFAITEIEPPTFSGDAA